MAHSRNNTQPLYTSSSETLLCFHFSVHTKLELLPRHYVLPLIINKWYIHC
jgi:hypothetical protein